MAKMGKLAKTSVICLSLALVAAGLSVPALADKENTAKTNKGGATKNIYVNAGLIGDHTIVCLQSATIGLVVDPPDAVVLYDPTAGTPVTTVPLGTNPPTTIIPPTTQAVDVCLGGSLETYVSPGFTPTSWRVWARDYVWNGCSSTRIAPYCGGTWEGVDDLVEDGLEAATMVDWTVDLKVAGFAEMRQTVSKPIPSPTHFVGVFTNPATTTTATLAGGKGSDPKSTQICVSAVPAAQVCSVSGQGTSQSHTRNINAFGFCGQARNGTAANPIRDPLDYANPAPPNGGYTTFTTVKAMFVDGPVFGFLDCPFTDGITGTLNPTWFTVASTINSVTCPGIVCIFEELPAVSSGCFFDKTHPAPPNTLNLAVLGIIGEAGWDYSELGCEETAVNGAWTNPNGNAQTVPDIILKLNLPTVASVS